MIKKKNIQDEERVQLLLKDHRYKYIFYIKEIIKIKIFNVIYDKMTQPELYLKIFINI
jgi:hypothetical protein